MGGKLVGARVLRSEDARLLTGRGEFVDDIRLPGMLSAAFLRSPFPHAKLKSIDARAALAISGVHAVFTHSDLNPVLRSTPLPMLVPNPYSDVSRTQLALAKNEVCYAGEAVALVVADNRYVAEDALPAIHVEYQPLPAVSDCRDAVQSRPALAHSSARNNVAAEFDVRYGDVAAAFAGAAHIFHEELWIHRGCAHPLECRGAVAGWMTVRSR